MIRNFNQVQPTSGSTCCKYWPDRPDLVAPKYYMASPNRFISSRRQPFTPSSIHGIW